MKNDVEFYGYGEQDRLDSDIEDTVRIVMEDGDYTDFPIKIDVYKPMSIAKDADTFAKNILEDILERLDEEYGDPDGDGTEPTENMKEASLKLAQVIINEYQSWACVKTGEDIEYSKEEVEKLFYMGEIYNGSKTV